MSPPKVLTLDALDAALSAPRAAGRRIVLCHGVFDLLHAGHIRHLQRAKREGDVLVVTVTADQFVHKGPGRPVFAEQLRAEMLAALECVDFVAINYEETAVGPIHRIKPSAYVKGAEYRVAASDVTQNILAERTAAESHGGQVVYTDEITFSSSSLLNEHFDVFPPATREYLKAFGARWSDHDVHARIRELSSLRALVVGDTIIDEYHYVTPLGQTGKGHALAVRYDAEEHFAGGALAVANHVAGFAANVTLVTGLGPADSREAFVRSRLLPGVTPHFFQLSGGPTLVKRRFVSAELAKFFEIYLGCDAGLSEHEDRRACAWLAENAAQCDVVIVPDFGNGFISSAMARVLSEHARFLCVNTQVNSGNRGFHVISRYPRVNFAALNEPELRLAAHNPHDPVDRVAREVGAAVQASHVAVTRGTQGAMMLETATNTVHTVPALSTHVVDRVGAGDAFLSLAGLCLGGGAPAELAAFVGSAAAALDVQIVCNREPVRAVPLLKYITTLLK